MVAVERQKRVPRIRRRPRHLNRMPVSRHVEQHAVSRGSEMEAFSGGVHDDRRGKVASAIVKAGKMPRIWAATYAATAARPSAAGDDNKKHKKAKRRTKALREADMAGLLGSIKSACDRA